MWVRPYAFQFSFFCFLIQFSNFPIFHMKKTILYLSLACCLVFASCATGKKAAINDLRSLTEHIVVDGSTYSFDDWKKAGEKYVKIQKKLSQYDLNAFESKEVGELTGQCVKGFATGSLTNLTGYIGGKIISAASFLKGLFESIGVPLFGTKE